MKIKICIPFYQDFEGAKSGLREMVAISNCIGDRLYKYNGHTFFIEPAQGTYVHGDTSNLLVTDNIAQVRNDYITGDYDLYFFIDSDIIWEFEDMLRLIDCNKSIIFGTYIGHVNKEVYQCGMYGETSGVYKMRFPIRTTGQKKVDWAGMGFACIEKKVFEKLEFPWFRHQMVKFGNGQREVGEDVGFCMLAAEHYNIWVDFDIKLKHRERPPVDWTTTKNKGVNMNVQNREAPRIPFSQGDTAMKVTNAVTVGLAKITAEYTQLMAELTATRSLLVKAEEKIKLFEEKANTKKKK